MSRHFCTRCKSSAYIISIPSETSFHYYNLKVFTKMTYRAIALEHNKSESVIRDHVKKVRDYLSSGGGTYA